MGEGAKPGMTKKKWIFVRHVKTKNKKIARPLDTCSKQDFFLNKTNKMEFQPNIHKHISENRFFLF